MFRQIFPRRRSTVFDGYKDFIVGVQHGKYVLRPTYQCDAMVYDNVNPWYTVPDGLPKIPTWYCDTQYPAGFHAYASPKATASILNVRCAVRLQQVHTLGVQTVKWCSSQTSSGSKTTSRGIYMKTLVNCMCMVRNTATCSTPPSLSPICSWCYAG